MQKVNYGVLYVVGTPIGNLEDISFRAIRILKDVDWIAAEDTRRTQQLLKHFGIQNRLESYHDHNKEIKAPILIRRLISGQDIAVVSDAGTPGISDPAYRLIREALSENISVVPVPGPTAAIAAVSVSGLPTDRFVFEGFIPVKKGRKSRIKSIKDESRTLIVYESPHRLLKTLRDLQSVLGDRPVAVCRELTKKFEEVIHGTISESIEIFSNRKIRGEFVLVIHGKTGKKA
ncbi:16S rRNA (cytidine(1402)-2'-O)-methyltransferase [bacterium]|nr:16S rRNA (cytidine(1402)-2'-O)-methyltransferase [bacterium]